MRKPTTCPFCTATKFKWNDDLSHETAHGSILTVCNTCEARALDGQWSSPRAVRRYQAAVENVRDEFSEPTR